MNEIEIAKIIRKTRREKEMTQKELAKKISVHPMQVYLYEKGKQIPSGKTLLMLMNELGLKQEDFLKKRENSNE